MNAGPEPMRVRAVVFDLDGVLVESEHVNVGSARAAFERFGFALPPDAADAIVGRHPVDYVPDLARRVGLASDRVPDLVRFQDGVYRERWSREVRLVDAADAVVRALGRQGFRLGLATSAGRKHVEACLDRFGLRGAFGAIVTKDDVARRKPDPEPYRLAVERLDVAPGRAVAVEDTPHGIASARRAGLRVVAVRTDHVPDDALRDADVVVDRIGEVVALLVLEVGA